MSLSRRGFFKTVGVAGVSGSALGTLAARADASAGPSAPANTLGVLVDIPKCIGCRRCEFACKEAAMLASEARGETKQAEWFKPDPINTFEDRSVFAGDDLRRPSPHCYTKISDFPNLRDPEKPVYVKANCLHCLDPACRSACLVGAFKQLEDGQVVYDAWKCMGCRYCMVACPFGIPTYEYEDLFTPQVRKCTLCADEGNPNKDKVPACVKICPEEVMTYGRRDDLLALAHEKIQQEPEAYLDHVYGEHEAGGTSWLYLAPKDYTFPGLGFVDVGDDPPPERTESIQHGIFKNWFPPLAWYALLGAMMWITKPEPGKGGEAVDGGHH
ncbi:MAG: 4Fe-4S dicluster domain-containing protein [Phycisphaerae bacterium]|jgi:Fe-S-cluster-containing dehydrogenase component